jgi:hypothetical protein
MRLFSSKAVVEVYRSTEGEDDDLLVKYEVTPLFGRQYTEWWKKSLRDRWFDRKVEPLVATALIITGKYAVMDPSPFKE